MRNARRADLLLAEADEAEKAGHAQVAAFLTRRARLFLSRSEPNRAEVVQSG